MPTYSPVGPFKLTTDEDTQVLAADSADDTLDALPLLDARLLARTFAPQLAPHGQYLALGDGTESRLLRLDGDVTHLGRGPGAEVRFDDPRVSRDHAMLIHHGRYLRLLDNHSHNGTFVNGRRIEATNLTSGDVIDLGPVRMQLVEVG